MTSDVSERDSPADCFVLTVGGRWLQGVFGSLDAASRFNWPVERQLVHYLPGRPHPRLTPGSHALYVNRSRPSSGIGVSRFLGSAVVDAVQCGTPGELLPVFGELPSPPRSVVYRLAADAGGVLTAVVCQRWVGFAHAVSPADAEQVGLRLSSGDRAMRRAIRIGVDQYAFLVQAGRDGLPLPQAAEMSV